MKHILALVITAVLISANAFAANLVATFGDRDSNGVYRVQASDDGSIVYNSGTSIKYGATNTISYGGSTATAFSYKQIDTSNTVTGTYTFSPADSGLFIEDFGGNALNSSAPGKLTGVGVIATLPACVAGTLGNKYEMIAAVREAVTVTPSTTLDSIDYSITGTGLNAGQGVKTTSLQAGDGIGVICVAPGQWQLTKAGVTPAAAP